MGAIEHFESVLNELGEKDRREMATHLSLWRSDILAARSEEARIRIVQDVISELNDRRTRSRRAPVL